MENKLLFVVDDDPNLRRILSVLLETRGYRVMEFESGEACLEKLDEGPLAVFLDLMMPGIGGLETLQEIKKSKSDAVVIMVTSVNEAATAVLALKAGAFDYIVKPYEEARLITTLENALNQNALLNKVRFLQEELQGKHDLKEFIGRSAPLQQVFEKINKVKDNNASVLIQGESGTGKELVARGIHYNGSLAKGCFVDINCGAIPETLQESELFGHKKGAFTGADESRTGKLELADGGTLFLDEVAEMSANTQTKLLRFLQEKNFERIGENNKISVNTRVIAATNKDLLKEVAKGKFREDLYYRLNVFPIFVPPLRERKEDIPLLCAHFLKKYAEELNKQVKSIDPQAMELLMAHPWPGNIRQLENTIYQAMIHTETDAIDADSLKEAIGVQASGEEEKAGSKTLRLDRIGFDPERSPEEIIPFEEVEKRTLRNALKVTQGNIPLAAKKLAMSRSTLYRLVKKYALK
ncbi:MAG: acetoacetate metabolism regulatory protein AtoC [Nitrospinaceae bacterium]|nr:MAG: acetoacetate metabolism regulatory protein AtoC [Nitrospinaceae bacterium]